MPAAEGGHDRQRRASASPAVTDIRDPYELEIKALELELDIVRERERAILARLSDIREEHRRAARKANLASWPRYRMPFVLDSEGRPTRPTFDAKGKPNIPP